MIVLADSLLFYQISMANVTDGRVHTMITSAFSHMNTEHLIKNMIALYFFGNSVSFHFYIYIY